MPRPVGDPGELELGLLGGFRVLRHGRPCTLQTRRTMGLLAFLAVTARPHSRAALSSLLWPGTDAQRARGNLRVLLHNLRRDVPELVQIERARIQLAPSARARVDVHRFEDRATAALRTRERSPTDVHGLRAALQEHAGPLLHGFDDDLGEPFADWLESERARLDRRLAAVLEALVDASLDVRTGPDPSPETVELAQRLVDLDPFREASQERLMRVLWRTGQRAVALAGFEAWVARLHHELGIGPSPGVQQLADRIRRDVHRARRDAVADPTAPWPLVAREDELAVLGASAMAARPEGGHVLLAGDAGLGKTRLLREALALARDAGRPTLWLAGTQATRGVPYGALAHLVPDAEVAATDPSRRRRTHAAAVLAAAAPSTSHDRATPVVVADDVHLFDDASASLVLHLVSAGRLTLLAGMRPAPSVPTAVTRLWRDGWVRRIDLEPLDMEDVGALLEAGLGGQVGYLTWRRMTEATGGNPLHVRELAIGAVASGALRPVDGVWRWNGEVALAPRLVEALQWRLVGLTEAQLEALAALGTSQPLPRRLLSPLLDDTALDELARRGLVAVVPDASGPSVWLEHPLYGEVAVDRLGRAGQQAVLRLLADTVDRDPDVLDPVRAVAWRTDAGLDVTAEELTEAAERANEAAEHDLALRLAETALDHGAGVRAALALGTAAMTRNDPHRVVRALSPHREEVLAGDDHQLAARWLRRLFGALHFALGRSTEAGELLDEVASRPDLDPAVRRLVQAHRTALLRDLGRPRDGLLVGEPLFDLGDTDTDDGAVDEVVFEVAGALMGIHLDLDQPRRAHAVIDGVRRRGRLADRDVAAHSRLWVGMQELVWKVHTGRARQALPGVEAIYAGVVADGDGEHHGTVGTLLGLARLHLDLVEDAAVVLRDAAHALARTDAWGGRTKALCLLAEAEARRGDAAASREVLEEAEREQATRHPRRFACDLARARGWVLAAEGHPADAAAGVRAAADAEAGRPAHRRQLRELARRLDGPS